MSRRARIAVLLVVLLGLATASVGLAVARWAHEQRPTLGTLVYDNDLRDDALDDRAHLRRVELGPGDTLDRLGVEIDGGEAAPDLPELAEGERRFGFVTYGCNISDPVLGVVGGELRVDWVEDPTFDCAPAPVHVTVFDVATDDVPPGTDLGGASVGVLDGWHLLAGTGRRPHDPEVVSRSGGTAVVRAVVAGCQEERPPYLNTVSGRLVAGFPDLGRQVSCLRPDLYVATFHLSTYRLDDVTGPALPRL